MAAQQINEQNGFWTNSSCAAFLLLSLQIKLASALHLLNSDVDPHQSALVTFSAPSLSRPHTRDASIHVCQNRAVPFASKFDEYSPQIPLTLLLSHLFAAFCPVSLQRHQASQTHSDDTLTQYPDSLSQFLIPIHYYNSESHPLPFSPAGRHHPSAAPRCSG